MLETIKNFFLGIANVTTSLIDFVVGFVGDIVYIVKLSGSFVAKIPSLFSWLPRGVIAMIVLIFTVVVIYKVMGREG